jgi:uncharacterized protein YkwD
MLHLRRCLLLAVLALAAVPAGAHAESAACAGTDLPLSESSAASARDAVLCLVNAERAARGVAPVAPEARLEAAATAHAVDMRVRSFFDHTNPDGASPGDRITAAGYAWSSYGENIAMGYRTPAAVMEGWMKSTGHCQNLLNPRFTELGVGVDATGREWVQNFGRPRGVSAPAGPDVSGACPASGLTPGALAPPAPAPSAPVAAQPPVPASVPPAPPAPPAPSGPASGDPAAGTPAGSSAGATQALPLPSSGTVSSPRRRLTARARLAGRRVRVTGRVNAVSPRSAVRVSVQRSGRRQTKTVRARGAFALDVRLPRGSGAAKVTVRAAGLTLRLAAM